MQVQTWRILHIDDDEDDQFLVRSMLKEAKGQTVTLDGAATFEEGRKLLNETGYQAVLVDYDLGTHTGIDLIREFVNRGYTAPFILLTGRGSYDVDVEAMRAGATLYLTKSEINPLLLERSIRYAIERKQVEAALRERDRKLSVALDAARLGAWTYYFTDHMFEMDERAQNMYNASQPRENHDLLVQRYYHPEDAQGMWAALKRAADPTGNGRYQAEYRILRPDGSMIWLSAWGLAEFEGQGVDRHAVRLTGASREITWEKQAELTLEETNTALRQSERSVKELAGRFQAVLENSLDVAYRRNLQTDRYDYMSPVVEQVMGFSVDEMINMSITETLSRIHSEDRPKVEEQMSRSVEQGKAKLEYRFLCKDGVYRWLADYVTVTKDAAGSPLYRTGIVRDVTDQRRAEQALRASEERFQLASRAVSGVLYDLSISRNELYQSEGLERVVGYRPGEEPGGSKDWWPRNIHPDDYPRVQASLQAAIESQTDSFAYEYRIRHKDGHWVHIWDQGYIVRDKTGQAQRVVGICTDISDRIGAEDALRESERDRQEAISRFRDTAMALEIERAKLAAAIDQLPLGIGISDAQGTTLSLNNAGLQLHGFASETEMFSRLDKYIQEFELRYLDGALMPVEDWPASKALRGEYVREYELRLRNKLNGTERIVSYSAAPVQNSEGELTLIVYVMQDLTDRKRAEEALRESETRYRLAARATNDAIWDWDLLADTLQWNESMTELFGYPPSDLCGSGDWWKLHIHPDDRTRVIDSINEVISGDGEAWRASYRFQRADGSFADINDRGWVVRDARDRPVRMVGAMRDITTRKIAEDALRQSEARFRQLADAMPQLVWTALPDGAVDYYNRRYQDYGGISPVDRGNWDWSPVLHPDDLQRTIAAWQEAVQTATTYQIEHRIRMADGSYRWHLSRGIPAFDEQGNVMRWYGTATDIHDFKQTQEMLRHREQRLRSLFESNLIGIVTRDQAGRIIEANNAYLQMTGYSIEDIESGRCNARDITPPEYHHLEQVWKDEVLTNGYCKPFEKEYIRKDGTRIPVLIGYSLYETDQAEFIGFVLDLTELKQAQAELAEYAEKLKRSNEELESFAFVASHDLQEPLRKINLFGSSLRRQMEGQLSEKAEDYLNRMQNATERMQAMINGLLELSRVNTGGKEFEPVNLNELAEEVISDLEARIQATGGRVIIGPLPTVYGDALQLRLLLQNLFGNALKFHKDSEAPVVRVTGELFKAQRTRLVKLVVEDNGIGFEEESANQIFQPFVRLHGRSQYEGSGMGLAICRKIVERHDGSIQATSQPGVGSKFVIILPLSPAQAGRE